MFSKLASWVGDRYKARKMAGSQILIGEVKTELERYVTQASSHVAELNAAKLTALEEMAELTMSLVRHGEAGTCTCGKCKDLIPQRKQQLVSIEQEANLLRLEAAPGCVQAEDATRTAASNRISLGVSIIVRDVRDQRLNYPEAASAIAELFRDEQELVRDIQAGLASSTCRLRLARAGFPIVLFPRLWVLLESCVAAKSEPILVDGLDFLLAKHLRRARSTARWRCDIEYAFKAIALVLSCVWDDKREHVQRTASRCWWLLIFAERVAKLATHIRDLLGGGR